MLTAACSLSARSQKRQPIWFPHWPTANGEKHGSVGRGGEGSEWGRGGHTGLPCTTTDWVMLAAPGAVTRVARAVMAAPPPPTGGELAPPTPHQASESPAPRAPGAGRLRLTQALPIRPGSAWKVPSALLSPPRASACATPLPAHWLGPLSSRRWNVPCWNAPRGGCYRWAKGRVEPDVVKGSAGPWLAAFLPP